MAYGMFVCSERLLVGVLATAAADRQKRRAQQHDSRD